MPETLVSVGLMPSSAFSGHQAQMWFRDIHAGKTFVHINKNDISVDICLP